MDLDTMARGMMAAHQTTKREACAEDGGPCDLSMLLDIRLEEGNAVVGLIEDRDLMDMMATLLTAAAPGRVRYVGLCSDAYGMEVETSPPRTPLRGTAAQAFQEGNPEAYELLTVTTVDVVSGHMVHLESRYRYNDQGQPEFDEVTTRPVTGLDVGQVPDNLTRLANRYREAWS